jgi:peptide/nickel transport system permease protein
MTTTATTTAIPRARESRITLRGWWPFTSGAGIVGLILLTLVVGVALIGPLVAPHSIAQPIGFPGAGPWSGAPLGTDFLGRDVLSRVLYGGLPVLGLSLAAIIPTYLIGMSIGLAAGLSRTLLDPVLMRLVDLVLCLPPLLLLLVLLAGAGTGVEVLIIGIVIVLVPGVARLVRTATLEVSTNSYIEAAILRGETRTAIAIREILPNISSSVLADLGVRFSAAVTLAASVNFLGLGSKPPAANWGLMIAENRLVLPTNVWAVLAPALLLTALAVSVNLLADAFEKSRQMRSSR